MDFDKYIRELNSDKEIIYSLQSKYLGFLKEHMKKKEYERDETWQKTRSMLFHIQGALSMTASGIRSWLKDR